MNNSKLQLPARPNLLFDLDMDQVDQLMSRVSMDNTFLRMATADLDLIAKMKQTIEYQNTVTQKREKLLLAITNNVQYLSSLHMTNNNELKQTRELMKATAKKNE